MSAQVTWQQISNLTRAFTNAKMPVADGNTLWFQVSIAGKRGFYKIMVELVNDTYTVKLVEFKRKTFEMKELAAKHNIYVAQLNAVIRDMILI